jgi:hypothetical protein
MANTFCINKTTAIDEMADLLKGEEGVVKIHGYSRFITQIPAPPPAEVFLR